MRVEAAIRSTADSITRIPLSEAIEDPYLEPNNPPTRTANENGKRVLESSNMPSETVDPIIPPAEFIQMKSADVAATCFGLPTCNMMRRGDSRTPPPIPTTPLTRPISDPTATHPKKPHRKDPGPPASMGNINLNPARIKTTDNNESYTPSFTSIKPPMKAIGKPPRMNGALSEGMWWPSFLNW
jgi:hypothetical protein